jgi:hypothetical protein
MASFLLSNLPALEATGDQIPLGFQSEGQKSQNRFSPLYKRSKSDTIFDAVCIDGRPLMRLSKRTFSNGYSEANSSPL